MSAFAARIQFDVNWSHHDAHVSPIYALLYIDIMREPMHDAARRDRRRSDAYTAAWGRTHWQAQAVRRAVQPCPAAETNWLGPPRRRGGYHRAREENAQRRGGG